MKHKLTRLIVIASIPLGLCALVALPILPFVISSHRYLSTRHRAVLTLPDGVHAIEHSRVPINTLVAEYSRDVTYVTNGVRGKTTPLQIDTCGGYPINCYLIETPGGPLLHLDDAVSEHLLDLTTQTTYAVTRVQGKAYIGELQNERASAGWSMRDYDSSTLSVTIGDVEAKPMSDLTQNVPEVYIGRFSGGRNSLRFTPTSKSPEIAIEHLFERRERRNMTQPDPESGIDGNEPNSGQPAR